MRSRQFVLSFWPIAQLVFGLNAPLIGFFERKRAKRFELLVDLRLLGVRGVARSPLSLRKKNTLNPGVNAIALKPVFHEVSLWRPFALGKTLNVSAQLSDSHGAGDPVCFYYSCLSHHSFRSDWFTQRHQRLS